MAFPSRTPSTARTVAWIAASCAAHVLAVVLLGARRHEPELVTPAPVEFEIETEVETATPALALTTPETQQVPGDPSAAPATARDTGRASNAVAPSLDVGPALTEAAPAASGSSWSVSAFKPGAVAILPPTNYAGMPEAAVAPKPQASAPGQLSQSGGLREALSASDTKRGVGRGGSAVSAAHQASNEAPSSGRLVLALTFDASGAATSVHIAERSDGDPTWDSYARAVLALAKKKPARALPEGAKGMVVTMTVESRMVLPSGSSSAIELKGAGAAFDLGDVGASPKKRVSAHIVKESLLY